MADIAGMQHEFRGPRQSINLVHRRLQGRRHIRVGRLVETHVTVADLNKAEVSAMAGVSIGVPGECLRNRNAAAHGPDQSSAGPSHALQKSASVDAIVVKVLYRLIDEI